MMIRLFTSGTHKGQAFSPEDIDSIAAKTQEFGEDDIPFVLGHPKKNLPIMGFVPKSALKVYDEGDGRSIGFEKADADMSDESMDVLRSAGQNKLSVRLRDGIIAHIGLVRKAAVNKNNDQDFGELHGDFNAPDELFEASKNPLKRIFNMDKTQETTTQDFSVLEERLKKLEEEKAEREAFDAKRKKLTADFSQEKYSYLSRDQLAECADFAACLPDSRQEEFKTFLAGLKPKPQTPRAGSLIADFGAPADDKRSTEDILRDQIKTL